eukprot:g39941.t1
MQILNELHLPSSAAASWAQRIQCITFATPLLVGDKRLARSIEQCGWEAIFHHVVYEHDPVPLLLSLANDAHAWLSNAGNAPTSLVGKALKELSAALGEGLDTVLAFLGTVVGPVVPAVGAVVAVARPALKLGGMHMQPQYSLYGDGEACAIFVPTPGAEIDLRI